MKTIEDIARKFLADENDFRQHLRQPFAFAAGSCYTNGFGIVQIYGQNAADAINDEKAVHIKKGALTDDMLLKVIAEYQAQEGTEIHVAELAEIIDRTPDTTGDRLRRLLDAGLIYRAGLSGRFRYGVMPPRG